MWSKLRNVINRKNFIQNIRALPLVMLLRKRHFSFLLLVNRASCERTESADMSSKSGEIGYRINITNGLLLYYHQYSFYSQKVVMALYEKNLPFDSHIVNISKGEQYQPWYLQINPRGEVPVLQDTGKIIPDSSRIIDYLEDNFSNGDTPRLIPMDQGPEIRQKVTYFRNIIDKLPAGLITMGSFFHPEFAPNPKIPFIAPVRKALANTEIKSSDNLRKTAELNPEAKETLLQKAKEQDIKHQIVLKKDEYLKVLDQVDDVLNKVEDELSKHSDDKKDWWLCTNRFTAADISLVILLERLNQLGLESRFWSNGKRPNIETYYVRVQDRDSYKKTIPNKFFLIKTILISQAPLLIGVSIAAAVAIIVGGVFLVKKLISK